MRNLQRTAVLLSALGVLGVAAILAYPTESSADPTGTIVGRVTARRASGRANAIVYIEQMAGARRSSRRVQIDQREMRFVPQVLPIVRGTTVRFLNNDATEHNVYSPDGERYDLGTWVQGETREHVFDTLGVYTQLCRLHPTMIGYVVVLQNRFFARTRRDGSFRIANVPAGTYQLRAWQERGEGGPTAVTVTDGEVSVEIPLGRRR